MKICESLYYYLLSPKEAIKKNINFEYSLIVYLITALTVSISVLYSIGSKSNILNLFIITFGIASYIAVSNIIKIAIINFTVFIFSKDNDKNNLRIFASNCFGIYGIFIFILPITLIFSKSAGILYPQRLRAGTYISDHKKMRRKRNKNTGSHRRYRGGADIGESDSRTEPGLTTGREAEG